MGSETVMSGLFSCVMGIIVQNCSIMGAITTFLSSAWNVHISLGDDRSEFISRHKNFRNLMFNVQKLRQFFL